MLLFRGPGEFLKYIPSSYRQVLPRVPLALGTRGARFQVSEGAESTGEDTPALDHSAHRGRHGREASCEFGEGLLEAGAGGEEVGSKQTPGPGPRPGWAPLGSCCSSAPHAGLHALSCPLFREASAEMPCGSNRGEQPTPRWHLLTSGLLSLPQGQG